MSDRAQGAEVVIDLVGLLPLSHREAARFVGNLRVSPQGCWIWTAGKTSGNSKSATDGGRYGKFSLRSRTVLAHRLLYAASRGAIANTLDHRPSCDRACVHPQHLEDVPSRINLLRSHGVMAMNARKVRCKRGHLLSGENLMLVPRGRMCRACRNQSHREYRKRKQQRAS